VRCSPLAAGALLAALGAAGFAGAGVTRSVSAPAPVSAVAFDGHRVAFSVGFSRDDCDRVRLWNLSTRGVSKLGRRTSCVRTSTGTAVAAVSQAGTRALWLHFTGGNIREWTLWTATGTRPTPRRLAFVARDVDAPPPIVLGDGNGSRLGDMLPYAIDRTVTVLRANGARRFAWTAPARVVALDARAGELAVAQTGGRVTVLDAAGGVIRQETYDGEVSAVEITGTGLLVQQRGTLELRGSGAPRTFAVGTNARLEDALGDRAVYSRGGVVTMLSLSSAARRTVGTGARAALEGGRLAVASGRRVLLLSV
jgi:outer membrane protein assembly factor BamB